MQSDYRQLFQNRKLLLKSNNGITLIELLTAIFICSIVVSGIFGIYARFVKSNMTLQNDIVLQERVQRSNNFLEKDLRMAGLNLPGNGILYDSIGYDDNDKEKFLFLFMNKPNRKTVLRTNVDSIVEHDSILLVKDECNAEAGMYVCILNNNEINYYAIRSVARHTDPEFDSIRIVAPGLAKTIRRTEKPEIFIADCISYNLERKGSTKQFVRRSNDPNREKEFSLTQNISNMQVIARDLNGEVIQDNIKNARTLSVHVLKKVKNLPEQVISSVEVAIRNFQ